MIEKNRLETKGSDGEVNIGTLPEPVLTYRVKFIKGCRKIHKLMLIIDDLVRKMEKNLNLYL